MDSWIALNDYAAKYRVSVSTLRRRIKATEIQFRLDDGKYFLMDEPISAHQRTHRPSQDPTSTAVSTPLPQKKEPEPASSSQAQLEKSPKKGGEEKLQVAGAKDEPILTAANRLLNELKKAYSQILQEKDEQILQLKDEQADLKTLIRVLEGENQRLKDLLG